MKLSTKAFLICCISTQLFTAHPKTFLIETEDNKGEGIKDPIEDEVPGPSENEAGTDYAAESENQCNNAKECEDLDKCSGGKCHCEGGVCKPHGNDYCGRH